MLEKDRAIRYLYDANGNKLRKIVFGEQGHIEYIRDYSGSFVYTDGAIDFILTEEGRVNNKPEGFIYEYFLKDHLGNTRVSFEADDGTINTTAETHYYPFGMTLHGLNQPLRHHRDPIKSQYLYNGKELQSDNGLEWYDYGARFYDAQLGRWHVPDPLAENHYDISPNDFVGGNPISRIDLFGLDWYYNDSLGYNWYNSSDKTYTDDNSNEYVNKGHIYSYQDEDDRWHNFYQNFGLETSEQIENIQGFLTGSRYWFKKAREELKGEYYNELYMDNWADERNRSSEAVLGGIAGITGAGIGAVEFVATGPVVYDYILNQAAYIEYLTGNISIFKELSFYSGYWLNHTQAGMWTGAAISALAPAGTQVGYTVNKQNEILIKWIKRCIDFKKETKKK